MRFAGDPAHIMSDSIFTLTTLFAATNTPEPISLPARTLHCPDIQLPFPTLIGLQIGEAYRNDPLDLVWLDDENTQ